MFLGVAGCSAGAASTASPGTSLSRESTISPVVPAERVEFPSGALQLHGLLWRPAGGAPVAAVLQSRVRGSDARRDGGHDTLLQSEQLDDVLAALAFLRRTPGIDPGRVAVMGHSFGGQLTLLAAAREPDGFRFLADALSR